MPNLPLVTPLHSLRETMTVIDECGKGIALVVDAERHLVGTVTDGDVRRAILAAVNLETPVSALLARNAASQHSKDPKPVTAQVGTERAELLATMRQHALRHIPILDDDRVVVDLVMLNDLVPTQALPLQAMIMAGGLGTRLLPLTENVPKSMLSVGDRPLMEHIVRQLRDVGIRHVNVATHYKPEKIIEHFGDGRAFGVELNYVNEDQPLGTGGALGLMPLPSEPLLVINGDILTEVDFRAMLEFHQEYGAEMTVAVRRFEMQVPYGVVECDGSRVQRLSEKPKVGFLVNAGIYLLEPTVFQLMPNGHHFNMTDLIQWLLDTDRTIVTFPIREYWLDIGQHVDYAQAQEDVKNGRMAN
jgi:dTDP-glucose pyrophosphorylase